MGHHYTVCLATDPWPLPKSILYGVRSSDSSLNFQHLLVCYVNQRLLTSPPSSSCPFYLYISKCFRRQFLRMQRQIYLVFLHVILRRVFLTKGQGNAVGIATPYGMDGPGIESRCGRDFPHPSRTALGPTQTPIE